MYITSLEKCVFSQISLHTMLLQFTVIFCLSLSQYKVHLKQNINLFCIFT